MAQETTPYNVTVDTWTPVAPGKTKFLITSNDILPFFVHVSATAPGGAADSYAGVEGSRGEPFSASDLDVDSLVFVRAKRAPTQVIVIA